jgi:hypothetical protein
MIDRSATLQAFGYTPRQAQFIALVAEHSGFFLRRQWLKFANRGHGHVTVEFFANLADRGHASRQGCIYHVASRAIYAAIGEEHNRHRRRVQPSTIVQKLMALDLVLAFPHIIWHGTERDKVPLFTEQFGLDKAILPSKTCPAYVTSKPSTTRYFVETLPIGVGASSSVTLAYIANADRTTDGFESFLGSHSALMARLPAVKVLYVSCGSDWGHRARAMCTRRYAAPNEHVSPHLAAHFTARQRLEAGGTAKLSAPEISQLRSELAKFRGPFYDRLYHTWRSDPSKEPPRSSVPPVEIYHLPYNYSLVRADREVA